LPVTFLLTYSSTITLNSPTLSLFMPQRIREKTYRFLAPDTVDLAQITSKET
jgi:hypothetical protein